MNYHYSVIDDVEYVFDDDGRLLQVSCDRTPQPKTVFIPESLKTDSGSTIEISSIGNDAFQGEFKKIVFPDKSFHFYINVFNHSRIEEIVWPSKNLSIPPNCFSHCWIKKITNIGNVQSIGGSAFSDSMLREIEWPSSAPTISYGCFANTALKRIQGVKNVNRIRAFAFADCKIEKGGIDLSQCPADIVFEKHCFSTLKRDAVILPYYFDESQIEDAFS